MIDFAVKEAEKAGMEDAIAKLEDRRETQIKFHNSDISVIKEWTSRQLSLFLAAGKKRFMLTLENPDRDMVTQAIANAANIMPLLAPTDTYHGIGRQRPMREGTVPYDDAITDTACLVELAEAAIDEAMQTADGAAGVLSAGTEHVQLASTAGIHVTDDNSRAMLSIRAFTDTGSGHAVRCARTLDGLHSEAGSDAARDASLARKPRQGDRGTYDIIFSSMAFANLIQHVAMQASAFFVDTGLSFLAGEQGKMVGDPVLTLQDSGIHPAGIASRSFDDEGIATGETTIIEHGRLLSYLHNTSTAHRYDTKTTANAGLVAPHPWNIVVTPGDASIEEMISEIDHGLYISNVWYTRFQNYRTGSFSTIPRDASILIENGEFCDGVTGIRLSDRLPRLLHGIELLARQQEQIYWWEVETPVFTPAALIRDVPVTQSFV